jgi:hypothetical protein
VKVGRTVWHCAALNSYTFPVYVWGTFHISKVQFFFRSNHSSEECTYALVSIWSELDMDLLQESFNTIYSCVYMGQTDLHVIDMKKILSVVAMVPMKPSEGARSKQFFLLEKPGLEIIYLGDVPTVVDNDNDQT